MMDGLLIFLCLLCGLVAPGSCLSCYTCAGYTMSCQGGKSLSCTNSSYSCGLAYRQTQQGGTTSTDYLFSCVPTSQCDRVGSISYYSGKMKMGISCCSTDNCQPAIPILPADSAQANGLTCPTCTSTTALNCTAAVITCTGSEQNCGAAAISSSVSAVSYESAVGCATTSLCDLKSYTYFDPPTIIGAGFFCYSGLDGCGGQTCLTGNTCAYAYSMMNNDVAFFSVAQACVPVNKCNVSGSLTVFDTSYMFGISCCTGVNCMSAPPSVVKNTTLNSVKCKTCSSATAASCDTNTFMACSGDEDQCVTYTQTAGTSVQSYRGCGKKTLCDFQSISLAVASGNTQFQFTCESRATITTHTTTHTTTTTTTTTVNNTASSDTINHLLLPAASLLLIIQLL